MKKALADTFFQDNNTLRVDPISGKTLVERWNENIQLLFNETCLSFEEANAYRVTGTP